MTQRASVAFACALGIVLGLQTGARAGTNFLRGDVDRNGMLQIQDAVQVLRYMFPVPVHGSPIQCLDAADVNDDGKLNVTDAIDLLIGLFAGGPVPPPPFASCGLDPTADALGCEAFDFCPSERSFFGLPLEEDGVFFVIDSSGAMQDSGELQIAKRELLRFAYLMQPRTQFAVIFFDRSLHRFPSGNAPASSDSPTMVESFRAYVRSVVGGSAGTCGEPGLMAALDYARASTSLVKKIIYVSDGGGTCPGTEEVAYLNETLKAVKAANPDVAVIDTIGVVQLGAVQEKYLRDLAEMNGGTFTRVTR